MSALQEAHRLHRQDWAVQVAYGQGMAYVWGRQDAGEGSHDTGPSVEFGMICAAIKELWRAEWLTSMGNIECQFLEWRATRRVLVRLSTPEQRGMFAVFCPEEYAAPVLAPVPWVGEFLPYWHKGTAVAA